MVSRPRVIVLGAGPAGLGAAWQLAARGLAEVTLLERADRVGGNAGSFTLDGVRVDFGSHRLHPACPPEILSALAGLLGEDLLDRPRRGRIRLGGRWIAFPPKPVDLALRLPPSFAIGVARDALARLLPWRAAPSRESFQSVLEAGLGRTFTRAFYAPYARKIWGVQPDELDPEQARRRVAASSLSRLLGKVLRAVPGLRPPGAGRFYYPRQGFGQISEALERATRACGAVIHLGTSVRRVEVNSEGVEVQAEGPSGVVLVRGDAVWSTIPVTTLVGALEPAAPADVAAAALPFRAMVLVYLVVETDRFTAFDAHYFPEAAVPMTRLSEPKNYAAGHGPAGATVLCAELPCMVGDATWTAADRDLGGIVAEALAETGIPIDATIRRVVTRRLSHAYPIYLHGTLEAFSRVDAWLDTVPRVVSFGRQGLFAHDNTHHTLAMAWAAVDSLRPDGLLDRDRWARYRRQFESHVVED